VYIAAWALESSVAAAAAAAAAHRRRFDILHNIARS
jgi:hypothetical protein